ncbi:MAG: ABC transporter substrate-binding protein [Anaerolineae bacterium]
MNRKPVVVLALLMVVLVLAACAAPEPEETVVTIEIPGPAGETIIVTATPEPVEECVPPEDDPYACADPTGQRVSFWHQHTREREVELLKIVNDFNTTNEWGITVTAEYQGSYNDIFNKMLAVLGTPDVPSLVVAYQNQSATYALTGDMVDMNYLVNSPTWGLTEEEKADFFPGFYAQDVFPTFGGARYGFPPNRSMEVMYYNIDWLNELYEAGAIDFEGPPTTPEQFKQAACAAVENPFSRATGDVTTSIGYELSIDASRFASWTFAFGGDVFDYEAGQYTYDNDAAVEAMAFLQDLFNEGCARVVTENYGDQTNFGAGVTLFTIGSSSGLPFYRSAVEAGSNHQWSVAAIPHTTPEPVMNIYGASVSIPVTNPDEELAAWLFVKYYTSPEIQARWAIASNYFPVRQSVAAGLEDYFAENPAFKTAFDLLPYGTFEPPVPGYDFVREQVGTTMAAIVDGADVATSLADLTAEANAILAEQQ